MTGKANLFSHLEIKKGGKVTFGENAKGKIIDIGQVSKKDSTHKMFFWLISQSIIYLMLVNYVIK